VAQVPYTTLSLPDEIQYFLYPLKVISQYRSCKLNKSKSFIESYSLGAVWKYIKGRPLQAPEMFGSGKKRRSVHDMCSSGSRKKRIIECTHEHHTLLI